MRATFSFIGAILLTGGLLLAVLAAAIYEGYVPGAWADNLAFPAVATVAVLTLTASAICFHEGR